MGTRSQVPASPSLPPARDTRGMPPERPGPRHSCHQLPFPGDTRDQRGGRYRGPHYETHLMQHSTHPDDIVKELLRGPLRATSDLRAPDAAGFYAWWCDAEHLADATPPIPREIRPPIDDRWSLLYVG